MLCSHWLAHTVNLLYHLESKKEIKYIRILLEFLSKVKQTLVLHVRNHLKLKQDSMDILNGHGLNPHVKYPHFFRLNILWTYSYSKIFIPELKRIHRWRRLSINRDLSNISKTSTSIQFAPFVTICESSLISNVKHYIYANLKIRWYLLDILEYTIHCIL